MSHEDIYTTRRQASQDETLLPVSGSPANTSANVSPGHKPEVSQEFEPDRQAMLAALRLVLGLPRVTSPLARPLRDLEPEA